MAAVIAGSIPTPLLQAYKIKYNFGKKEIGGLNVWNLSQPNIKPITSFFLSY